MKGWDTIVTEGPFTQIKRVAERLVEAAATNVVISRPGRKQVDTYVWRRLFRFMVRGKGRDLRAGDVDAWDCDFFHGHGLHRLRGTVKYPEAA